MATTKIMNSDSILSAMTDELYRSPKIYHPSNFWRALDKIHLQQVTQNGLKNFKRTVNTSYFSWGILGLLRHQLSPLVYVVRRKDVSPFLKSQFDNYTSNVGTTRNFNSLSAFLYRSHIASFSDLIRKTDSLDLLNKLEEPNIGNPFVVTYKNRRLTQDLCNSIHEFYSIINNIHLPRNSEIAELGAGYGRLAVVFVKSIPSCKYTIIDIPPALFVSQIYLSQVFHGAKIFRYQHFKTFNEIKSKFESSRLRFLLPPQLEKFPPNYLDLIINISSLHEMSRPQIKNYFNLIYRLGARYFYTKQWRRSRTKDNNFISEYEYPVPRSWKVIYHRTHQIQRMFFEALYKLR